MKVCILEKGAGRFVPWTFRTQDFSYPGWTIRTQRFERFEPKVWTIRTQGLDDSYPKAGRFVSSVLNFFSSFGLFVPQIVKFIRPVQGWTIRTHFLFLSHTWFGCFVPKFVRFLQAVEGWTICTQCFFFPVFFFLFFSFSFFFNFYILFGLFVPKLLRAGRFVLIFPYLNFIVF